MSISVSAGICNGTLVKWLRNPKITSLKPRRILKSALIINSDKASSCHIRIIGNWYSKTGSFLSATFDKIETAALLSTPFDLIGIMFSGIYLNLASASPYVSWIRYISGFYYGTEAISILQWDYVDTITCVNIPGIPCIRTGRDVLVRFGFDESHLWRNNLCLIVMYFGAHLIAYLMVVKRSKGTPVY